ncbi:MAG: O-antigen ligase family protein, partial [Patescibacteria group bacterium]
MLVIPLAGYLFFKAKKLLIKFFWFLVLASQLLCLFFTYSRGGLFGLVAGLTITALIYFLTTKQRIFKKSNFKRFAIAFLLLIIFTSLCFVSYYKINFFKERIRSSLDFQSGSVAIRTKFWKASLSVIKEKLLFGHGLDNQGNVLIKYYQKDWGIYGNVNDYTDRAHNLILDILLTIGAIGLIFYLLWLFIILKLSIKNIRENKSTALTVALLAGIVCYLLSLMFSFEITTTAVYLWLFFALIMIINDQAAVADDSPDKTKPLIVVRSRDSFKMFLAIILIIIIAGLIFRQINKNIKYLIADYYCQQIKQAFKNKEYFETYTLYGYLKELEVKTDYYDLRYGSVLADNLDGFNTITLTRIGQKILEKLVKNLKSDNFETFFALGKIYTALGNNKN